MGGEPAHEPISGVPAKISLTKRILASPALPDDLRRQKGRIMSNAYLRCLDFLPRPSTWGWAVYVLLRAVIASPLNLPHIVEQVGVHAAWLVPGLRRRLRKRYGHGVTVDQGSPFHTAVRGSS